MDKLKQQPLMRQHQQKHQRNALISSTSSCLLCGVTILLLCGIVSGNGNLNAAGHHNYSTGTYEFPTEQRSRRDVATRETEVQQSTLVPNANGDPEDINGNKNNLMSQSIDEEHDNPLRELNIRKRAPSGFIGMRGKKEDPDDNGYNSKAIEWDINPLYQAQITRNDDTEYDDAYDPYVHAERFKKAPTAFYGVRGKKYPNNDEMRYNRLNGVLRELQEEELRERMLQDFIGNLAVATAEQNEIIKRAPTGFTGLRGKRPAYDWATNKWQLNFAGDDDDSATGIDGAAVPEKRAPTNAFVGVRGKKDVDNQPEPEYEHQNLFKRSPSQSFGGGGGKRRFGGFNNKFVAVRGKKDLTSTEAAPVAYNVRQRLRYLKNSMPVLVYGRGMSSYKRAPSGFVGMRGKRAANVPNEATYLDAAV